MDRKIIVLIIVIILVLGGVIGAVILQNNNSKSNLNKKTENLSVTNSNKNIVNNEQTISNNQDTEANNQKALVLYFSATGTTEGVAKKIGEVLGIDVVEIQPQEEYTSEDLNYNNDNCRANEEQNDENARPEIANKIDISNYDTIYLGYPIWWGRAPKIIFTLLDNYNFNGKNVIPFCTSGGSDISQSISELKDYNKNINWLDGRKFNSSVSNSEIEKWIEDLGL